MFSLANQPQGIGKVLDSGVRLYLAGFKKFIVLALILGFAGVLPQLMGMGQIDPARPETMPNMGLFVGAILVMIIVSLSFTIAIVHRIGGVAAGRDTGMGDSIGIGLKRMIPYFFASILYGLAVGIGMVLLVIPGLILMITLSFYLAAMILDGDGPIAALKHSHNLAWGNWWRVVVVYTIPGVIVVILYMAIGAVVGGSMAMNMPTDPENFGNAMQVSVSYNVAVGLLNALVTPLFYAIMVTLYHDLKLRKEGGDLAARMAGATA